jgi:transposase
MENGSGDTMSPRNHRKVYDGAFKARVVVEVLRGEKTLAEIASEYEIHPNQIVQWKKHVLDILPDILSRKTKNTEKHEEEMQDELYKQIGELKVENEFLKKTWRSSPPSYGEEKNDPASSSRSIHPPAEYAHRFIPFELLLPSCSDGSFESRTYETHRPTISENTLLWGSTNDEMDE